MEPQVEWHHKIAINGTVSCRKAMKVINNSEFRCVPLMFSPAVLPMSHCEVGRYVSPGQWPGGRPAEGPERK